MFLASATVMSWISYNFWGIIAVIFTFGFLIFVHELGHFLMAKRVGMTVHEFALGFGPQIYKRKDKEGTEYSLRIIPFGGFVKLEGEDEPGNAEDPGNFNSKTIWQRAKVIMAGCVMNYITGITFLLIVGFIWGITTIPAQVDTLVEGYPMETAGIQKGDIITKVDNVAIDDFEQLAKKISPIKDGREVLLTVRRGSEEITVKVPVKYNQEEDRGMLGFGPPRAKLFTFVKVSPGKVIEKTLITTGVLTISPAIVVHKLISKEMTPNEVAEGSAGPLGISQMIFEISLMGFAPVLYIFAVLNILIGAFNLIPFPALDGSRLFFLLLEKIRKKPLDPDKEGMIHQVGFIILIVMVVIVTWNDIIRIVSNKSILK